MTVQLITGDCRDVLKTLADGSVHCCVTSPPYFGLRDYGTGTWEGGDSACAHSVGGQVQDNKAPGAIQTGVRPGCDASTCRKCGAQRVDQQIGLEPTPDAFVAELVAVFREVRRVLRDDGTLWLNLGDSYAGSWGAQSRGGPPSGASTLKGNGHIGGGPKISALSTVQVQAAPKQTHTGSIPAGSGLKPKDLIGVPWRAAFALQSDGWYLRQDIIWSKPNPMPESVTDRCTKAHEYVFLLSKSQRYYFDAAAIAEPAIYANEQLGIVRGQKRRADSMGVAPSGNEKPGSYGGATRNKRSVWTIATQPYSEAHFATMAPELAETCILAGCPEGGTVLDPFGGAGTTGLVADRLQRNAILIELNPTYRDLAEKRITGDAPLFVEIAL